MSFGQHRAHGNRMHGIKGSVFALTLVCILSVSLVAMPYTAYAESLEDLQANIEKSNNDYNNATNQVADLQQKIQDNETRIKEIENQLPEQRSRAAASIANTYRMQQGSLGIIDLILSTDNFNDLISLLQYLNIISNRNTETINNLVNLSNELDATKKDLNAQMAEAEKQKQAASEALQEAVDARNALQKQMEEQRAAEKAQEEAAIAEAQKKAQESNNTFTNASGQQTDYVAPSDNSSDNSPDNSSDSSHSSNPSNSVDWSDGKSAFVSKWSGRIDAYLSGSPLAGYGSTFAEAAWEYGVDPRFSPAISAVESTKGAYCFRPHNAWGWGSSSWGSWEEAIWAHVAGLASGYDGYLTYSGAAKYNPANPNGWYSAVQANMNMI